MSKGPEVARVSDVRQKLESLAKRELRKHGFTIGKVTKSFSDSIAKDLVISVSPAPGSAISREIPIDMVVSKGPEPTTTAVPNVVGDLLSEAKQKIEKSGFTVGTIVSRQVATSNPGIVISQSRPPGTSAAFQSSIDLVVAVGK
jgi:serine/threonine-protein kinase